MADKVARYSVWKSDPAMDSWYHAATGNGSVTGLSDAGGDMKEAMLFDITKNARVNSPSLVANDWFYKSNSDFNINAESK